MNTKQIVLEDGRPTTVTVEMSIAEAAAIAKVFGGFSYTTFTEKVPQLTNGEHSEVYDCLVGEIFNRYWDDGVEGFLNGDAE